MTVEDQARLEQVQRRAERCIRDGKVRVSRHQRREDACAKLFDKMRERKDPLLPPLHTKHIARFRAASNVADGQLDELTGTKRYTDSFVPAQNKLLCLLLSEGLEPIDPLVCHCRLNPCN